MFLKISTSPNDIIDEYCCYVNSYGTFPLEYDFVILTLTFSNKIFYK